MPLAFGIPAYIAAVIFLCTWLLITIYALHRSSGSQIDEQNIELNTIQLCIQLSILEPAHLMQNATC